MEVGVNSQPLFPNPLTMMMTTFIESAGEPVTIDRKRYVPIRFSSVIPRDDFTSLCHTVLYGNECVYSKRLKKWFCLEDEVDTVDRQSVAFLEDKGVRIIQEDDLGERLADLYGKE